MHFSSFRRQGRDNDLHFLRVRKKTSQAATMLYIFLVDTGNMIQLDMNLALETVGYLKGVIARSCCSSNLLTSSLQGLTSVFVAEWLPQLESRWFKPLTWPVYLVLLVFARFSLPLSGYEVTLIIKL